MSVTLKPWMAALTIAVLCALLGFAVGQVTTAHSEKASTSSYQDRQILGQLKKLNRAIGSPSGISSHPSTVLNELDDIRTNTGEVCWELTMQMACED